jgi:membrane protein implicated in regulation of membrane protease activity
MRRRWSTKQGWLTAGAFTVLVGLAAGALAVAGAASTAFTVAIAGAALLAFVLLVLGAGLLVSFPPVRGERQQGASQIRSYQDTYKFK